MPSSTEISDTYVLSDLHLAEGNIDNGCFLGTENFFADLEFEQFIHHLIEKKGSDTKPDHIIINGDFVDFIRCTIVPNDQQYAKWQEQLDLVGVDIQVDASTITKRERNYGLKTNDYKTIWKLYLIINGHPKVFESLAIWVGRGNKLTIGVGNHDPEWYWPLLQTYFRKKLFHIYNDCTDATVDESNFNDLIGYYIGGTSPYEGVWIEHGNQYDRMTRMCPDFEYHTCSKRRSLFDRILNKKPKEVPPRERELFLPFGSFFNRYLINKVEFKFPEVDNVTTQKALITTLFKEDFGTSFSLLWHWGLYSILVVLKSFRRSIVEVLITLLVTVLPLALFAYGIYHTISSTDPLIGDLPKWIGTLLASLGSVLLLALRYLFKFLLKKIGLIDDPLPITAFKLINPGGKLDHYNIILFGHNHNPEHQIKGDKQYLNTGTWISKYVFKSGQVQAGVKNALVHLEKGYDGSIRAKLLQWDKTYERLIVLPSFSRY